MEDLLEYKNQESRIIYGVKAIALYSVVMAHSAYTDLSNDLALNIFGRISTVGIFLFFLISGYFYTKNGKIHKYGFKEFWKRKVKSIFIPWLLNATAFYLVLVFCEEYSLGVLEYSNFILGNGTLFYYMTVLCICYVICWKIIKYDILMWIMVVINVLSVLLTAEGVMIPKVDIEKMAFSYLNPYLNVFNWCGIFVLGIVARKYNVVQRLLNISKKKAWITIMIGLVVTVLLTAIENESSYWTRFSFVIEFILSVCAFLFVNQLPGSVKKILERVGKISLPIYFWHMLLVNLVLNNPVFENSIIIILIRPIVVIGLMGILVYTLKEIAKKIHMNAMVEYVLGIRV